jgi:CTP synthase
MHPCMVALPTAAVLYTASLCSLVEPVKITLIGKYTGLSDAYLSVIKSLQHACMEARLKLQVRPWQLSGSHGSCGPG